jgi:hypothetical protein
MGSFAISLGEHRNSSEGDSGKAFEYLVLRAFQLWSRGQMIDKMLKAQLEA